MGGTGGGKREKATVPPVELFEQTVASIWFFLAVTNIALVIPKVFIFVIASHQGQL